MSVNTQISVSNRATPLKPDYALKMVLESLQELVNCELAVVLGFDGGRSDDATVLVALRVSDCFIEPLHLQERPDGPAGEGWQVDRGRVDAAVHAAFERFNVVGFYADVAPQNDCYYQQRRLEQSGIKVFCTLRRFLSYS